MFGCYFFILSWNWGLEKRKEKIPRKRGEAGQDSQPSSSLPSPTPQEASAPGLATLNFLFSVYEIPLILPFKCIHISLSADLQPKQNLVRTQTGSVQALRLQTHLGGKGLHSLPKVLYFGIPENDKGQGQRGGGWRGACFTHLMPVLFAHKLLVGTWKINQRVCVNTPSKCSIQLSRGKCLLFAESLL